MLAEYIYEDQCSLEIILVILPRLADRLPHSLEACKVNARIDLFFVKDLCQSFAVKRIALIESHLFAGDLLDTFKALFR